jgi:hypothetical protein
MTGSVWPGAGRGFRDIPDAAVPRPHEADGAPDNGTRQPYLGATSTFIRPCFSATTRTVVPVFGGSTPYQPGW